MPPTSLYSGRSIADVRRTLLILFGPASFARILTGTSSSTPEPYIVCGPQLTRSDSEVRSARKFTGTSYQAVVRGTTSVEEEGRGSFSVFSFAPRCNLL